MARARRDRASSLQETSERGTTEALLRNARGARGRRGDHDQPERTHSAKDGPAVAPFEPEDSYCPVGQTCDVACAKGYAGFDAAKNCKNANSGYCCK